MNLLVLVAIYCASFFVKVYGQKEVNTSVGLIRGQTSVTGGIIYTFLGIPYAKPPIGNLRFKNPEKPDNFEYPFVANLNKPFCPQMLPKNNIWDNMPLKITRSDEDCLYLNIYVPDRQSQIPVMVFLHGENFQTGRGDIYDAENLARKGGVIVVTLNYRLGIFGFLSTGAGTSAPGNMGLRDQHMALEWVRDNIAAFGGDPSAVTLMGFSSGATSAALHALSEKSKGLFKRVILEGGGVSGPAFVSSPEDALKFARAIGIQTECYKADNSVSLAAMVTCLRGPQHFATVLAIRAVSVARADNVRGLLNSAWVPVIDGDFIPDHPTKLLADHSYLTRIGFYDLDIMLGVSRNEGTTLLNLFQNFISPTQYPTLVTGQGISSVFMINSVIPALVGGRLGRESIPAQQYVQETYPTRDTFTTYPVAFSAYGDAYYVAPVIQFAKAHSYQNSGAGKTFLYLFDYSAAVGTLPSFHGSELPYVFGLSPLVSQAYVMPVVIDDEDRVFSDQVVSYWTNFMKSGDPNIPQSVPVTWPVYDSSSKSHIKFTRDMTPASSVAQDLRGATMPFWLTCFPGSIPAEGDTPFTCPSQSPNTSRKTTAITTTTTTTPKPNNPASPTTTRPTSKATTTMKPTSTPKPSKPVSPTSTAKPKDPDTTTTPKPTSAPQSNTTPKPTSAPQPTTTPKPTPAPQSNTTPKPEEPKTDAPTTKRPAIWIDRDRNGAGRPHIINVLTIILSLMAVHLMVRH